MTPDQLPAGLRVKALEWSEPRQLGDAKFRDAKGCGFMYIDFIGLDVSVIGMGGTFDRVVDSAAAQLHHEEQVCAQLEIVNG